MFVNREQCSFGAKGILASEHKAAGLVIINYSDQVVRMDMTIMMEQGHNIVAVSMYRSSAVEIMNDFLEQPLYLEISNSGSITFILFVTLLTFLL